MCYNGLARYTKKIAGNVSEEAPRFAIARATACDVPRRLSGDVADRFKLPKSQPNKAPDRAEQEVLAAENKAGLYPLQALQLNPTY